LSGEFTKGGSIIPGGGKIWRIAVVIMALALLLPPVALAADRCSGRQGGLPDLTFQAGSNWTRPASPVYGDDVWLFVRVQNIGDADYIGTYVVGFWLVWTGDPETSVGLTPTENDADMRDLPAGGSVEVNLAFKTIAIGEGNHTVTVVVDDENLIEESNETNNVITFDFNLPPPLPVDVSVQNGGISIDPPSPLAGDNVTIRAKIANAGPGMARSVDAFFYLNDTDHPISTGVLAANITPGSSETVRVVWNTRGASAAGYRILVFLHPAWSHAWMESDTDPANNNASLEVTLGTPGVELRLDSFSVDPPRPNLGEDFTVGIGLTNTATRTVVEVPVVLLLDESPILVRSLELRNFTSSRLDGSFSSTGLSEGDHVLRLSAANIDEKFALTVHVPRPDLAVLDMAWTPLVPNVGDIVNVSVKVANVGDVPSPECELALYGSDGGRQASAVMSAIRPGHFIWQELDWNTSMMGRPGLHDMRVVVDSGNTFDDLNRTNNSLERDLTIGAVVDLSVGNLTVAPSPLRRGDVAVFSATVHNPGSSVSGVASASIKVDGRLVDLRQVGNILPPGSSGLSLSWDTAGFTPGNHSYELEVAIAPGNGPGDVDASNNILSGTVELLPPAARPDLVVGAVRTPDAPVRVGDRFVLGVVVENPGDLDAGACSLVVEVTPPAGESFRLTPLPIPVPPVPAGGAVSLNITANSTGFAPGPYVLDAFVDSQNAVAESDETDNHLVRTLSVLEPAAAGPKLDIGDIRLSGKLQDGEAVVISVVVRNLGAGAVSGAYVEIYVDGRTVWASSLESIAGHGNRTCTVQWTAVRGIHTLKASVSAAGGRAVSGVLPVAVQDAGSTNAGQAGEFALGTFLMLLALAALVLAVRKGRSGAPRPRETGEEE
jgi:subtilase family serine protease